ncbi:MAG: hypothetical protein VZR32_07025, partial [Candidatus Weimeria sp.]|nr:hypothetical protein [Candidatus Weimeria sp.]
LLWINPSLGKLDKKKEEKKSPGKDQKGDLRWKKPRSGKWEMERKGKGKGNRNRKGRRKESDDRNYI